MKAKEDRRQEEEQERKKKEAAKRDKILALHAESKAKHNDKKEKYKEEFFNFLNSEDI